MIDYSDDDDDKDTEYQTIQGQIQRQFRKSFTTAMYKMEFRKKKGKVVNGPYKAFATKARSILQ